METFKGTPAPWNFKYMDNTKLRYSCSIYAENGDAVCKMLRDDSDSKQTELANAALISAAPDLLEALQRALNDFKSSRWTGGTYDQVEAAISKALGNGKET